MKTRDQRATAAGFTLIEVMITLAVMVPLMAGIAMTTTSVNDAMEANSRSADVMTYSRRMLSRIGKLVRPAQMSSIRVQAVAQDVAELRAAKVGDWILPTDLIWRPGFEFRSASGLLSMNAKLTTSLRRVVFLSDPAETANGVDDDGDGLVDEGQIMLLQNTVTLEILKNVENLEFALDGRVLKIRLGVARSGSDRRVYRQMTESEFYIRNN